MAVHRFGWWCSCGTLVDMEMDHDDPVPVLERVMATTVALLAVHTGDGHDMTVTRGEALYAWCERFGFDGDMVATIERGSVTVAPERDVPPENVPGQIRGDFWRNPLARLQFLGVTTDAT